MELGGRDAAPEEAPPGGQGGAAGPRAAGPRGASPPPEEEERPREAEEGAAEGAPPPPGAPVELPPCHGLPGAPLGMLLDPAHGPPPPPGDPEPSRELPARGKCLMGNWQEERATNHLDRVPGPACGSEGFAYRHGHRGLLSLRFLAGGATSTTTKDSYRSPRRTGLPVRGQREALLEWSLYQKHSQEVFEEQVAAPHPPMESQSVTHQDFCQEGFPSVPPAPSKPHDYRLEQAQTFWMEHAHQVSGISSIRTSDIPFKKCATFTTPVAEYLDQPMP